MTKYSTSDRENAIARLHEFVKPGDTIYVVLRHVSRSGMSCSISAFVTREDGPFEITYWAARAMGDTTDQKNGGIKMGGCGMDMGLALVYNLSSTLFRDGFTCIGQGERDRCPSDDHSNGDRDYTPHHHASGGYALRHRWL